MSRCMSEFRCTWIPQILHKGHGDIGASQEDARTGRRLLSSTLINASGYIWRQNDCSSTSCLCRRFSWKSWPGDRQELGGDQPVVPMRALKPLGRSIELTICNHKCRDDREGASLLTHRQNDNRWHRSGIWENEAVRALGSIEYLCNTPHIRRPQTQAHRWNLNKKK